MTQERKPKIPLEDVSDAERAMIEGALRGDDVDLAQYAEEGRDKAQIRAAVLRDLILGRYGPVHERGVRIRNVHIPEQLNLSDCSVNFPIQIRHCIFGEMKLYENFLAKNNIMNDPYFKYWDEWDKIVPLMMDRIQAEYINIGNSTIYGGVTMERSIVDKGIFMPNCKIYGHSWFSGAKIGGQFVALGCKFHSMEGDAFNAQGIYVKDGVYFRENAEFIGEVCFVRADIGALLMGGALLVAHPGGEALRAQNCRVRGNLHLNDRFVSLGEVVLRGIKIEGELDISESQIISRKFLFTETKESNIKEEFMEKCRELNKKENLEANYYCIHLDDSVIKRIKMQNDKYYKPKGIVDLTRARVEVLEDYADGWLEEGTDKAHMVLDGFVYQHLLHPSGRADGKGWHEAERIADNRIRWLDTQKPAHRTHEFRPQPWTQLISVLRRDGFIDAANTLDIRRRRRMRKYVTASRLVRAIDWFLDVVAGYGYKPWRTVGVSLAVILAFMVLWTVAMLGCAHEGCRDESVFVRTDVAGYSRVTGGDTTRVSAGRGFHPLPERFSGRGLQTPSTTFGTGLKTPSRNSGEAKGAPTYPDFNPVGFSFDVFIPLFNFGYQDTWSVNASWKPFYQRNILGYKFTLSWGGILYILYLLEIFLGAILTTIAIAGFTGLLRGRRNE